MKPNQTFSPKYWVGHDKDTDDVYISTASKSHHEAEQKMIDITDDFYVLEKYDIILVSLRMVNPDG